MKRRTKWFLLYVMILNHGDLMYFMYVICIGILPHYVMLLQTLWYLCSSWYHVSLSLRCRWRISAFSSIMRVFPYGVGDALAHLARSSQAYMGRVWESTTHSILLQTRKSSRSCCVVLKDRSHHVCVCFHYLVLKVLKYKVMFILLHFNIF